MTRSASPRPPCWPARTTLSAACPTATHHADRQRRQPEPGPAPAAGPLPAPAVADPPVMIMDEATSSIDTHTEAIVQRGMDALMTGRTTFVIAPPAVHRAERRCHHGSGPWPHHRARHPRPADRPARHLLPAVHRRAGTGLNGQNGPAAPANDRPKKQGSPAARKDFPGKAGLPFCVCGHAGGGRGRDCGDAALVMLGRLRPSFVTSTVVPWPGRLR